MDYNRTLSPISNFRVRYLLLIIGIMGGLSSCDHWSQREVGNTKDRGEAIRTALERFHKDSGSYPIRLDVLTTKYQFQIPQPTVGQRQWKYEVFNNGASYALSVQIQSQSEPLLQATSESDWTFDTK